MEKSCPERLWSLSLEMLKSNGPEQPASSGLTLAPTTKNQAMQTQHTAVANPAQSLD